MLKKSLLISLFVLLASLSISCTSNSEPNFIIILTDDQGYQDLGCYGSPDISTPNIDKLAEGGIKFTDYYVASAVCTPSRASLLTGRRPIRHRLGGVTWPDKAGLNPNEITIAELLKKQNYKSICIGKWHLGDSTKHLPLNQGFDEYFGIPYSNDMYIGAYQHFSQNVHFTHNYNLEKAKSDQKRVLEYNWDFEAINNTDLKDKVPIFEGDSIIEYPAEQSTLTERYFKRAIDFISKNKNDQFFVYLASTMPHVPLHPNAKFAGQSKRGIYGDVIEEIDWNVGNLISFLDKEKLLDNTFIIFTSDNGPWLGLGESSGSALPLRDGKFSIYEGGVRVPAIFYWKNHIISKVSNEIVTSLDIFPTIAKLADIQLPTNLKIDGINISDYLFGNNQSINRETVYHSINNNIKGVREGDWKYLPGPALAKWKAKDSIPELFNLKVDLIEKNNLIKDNPDKVEHLKDLINTYTKMSLQKN